MKTWMVSSIAYMRVHGICVRVRACMVQCALCVRTAAQTHMCVHDCMLEGMFQSY
jgi:hypothetical protein